MQGSTTTIRAATPEDADALGLITVTASLGAFLGHIPEELLDLTWTPSASARGWRRTLHDLDSDDFFDVAETSDGHVVGFVWSGPSTRPPDVLAEVGSGGEVTSGGAVGAVGEVRGLYVLPTRQGHGIGRRLLVHAANELSDRSMPALLVGCIRENPSCGFYRHLGGTEAFRAPRTVDRYPTEEIVFSWADGSSLD